MYTCLNCKMCSKPKQHIIEECNLDEADIYYSSWCDKIGGKIWWYSDGGCEDMYMDKEYIKKPKTNKNKIKNKYYYNKQYDKEKLEKLRKEVWWAVTMKNEYRDEGVKFLQETNFATNTRRFYKKYSNHCVRKNKDFALKGNGYRKVYDYWYRIW